MSVPHCPLLGAHAGFSRASDLQPGLVDLLHDSQPLFFPAGKYVSQQISVGAEVYLRSIYLPEVCNVPLGMRCPVDIGWDDFLASLQGALGPAGTIFQHTAKGLEPWFKAIQMMPDQFVILSCAFLPSTMLISWQSIRELHPLWSSIMKAFCHALGHAQWPSMTTMVWQVSDNWYKVEQTEPGYVLKDWVYCNYGRDLLGSGDP
jgi:hypothetical protein